MFKSLASFLGRKEPLDWVVLLLFLLLGGFVGHELSRSYVWIPLRAKIYQTTTTLGRELRFPQRTATVLLDDEDFWDDASGSARTTASLAGRVPTNRAYLAQIIEKLDAANAPVIALDFDLRVPRPPAPGDFASYENEDAALWAAVKKTCSHGHHVIFASVIENAATGVTEAPSIYDNAGFSDDCVRRGYIQLPRDIRRVPGVVPLSNGRNADSLALAAVHDVDPLAYARILQQKETAFPYSQFIPEATFRDATQGRMLFTGREVLQMSDADLGSKLLTRIVLVGAGWHTLAMGQGPIVDTHPSPGGELSGVLLHANYIEAALNEKLVKPFPDMAGEILDGVLVALLVAVGMLKIHLGWKWSLVLVTFLLVMGFSYVFLQTFGIFLDFLFPLLVLGLHTAFEHIHEWRHIAKHQKHRAIASVEPRRA